MRADTSNADVNPFFVHGIAGLGMHFRAKSTDSPAMVRLHARYSQLALEHMVGICKGNDAHLKVQAHLLCSTGGLYGRWFDFSRQCLTKGCAALGAAKLQFTPTVGHLPALTEDVLEKFAVLSQSVYFENYLYLAVDGIEPKMTGRIEKEFRHELPASLCFFAFCGAD